MPILIEALDKEAIVVEHDPKLDMYFIQSEGVFTAGRGLVFDTAKGNRTEGNEIRVSAFDEMGLPILVNGEMVQPNRQVEVNGMRILGL